MSRQFFATKSDMEPGLRAFEAKYQVKYVSQEEQTSPDLKIYHSVFDIPNLGLTPSRHVSDGPSYFILPIDAEVIVKHIAQFNGEHWFMPDWEKNPAVVFRPGGWYGDDVLMGGSIGVTRNSEISESHLRVLRRVLMKGFTAIPDYRNWKWWVGPEALVCLDTGIRLVTSTLETPNIAEDLRRPRKCKEQE